MTSAIDPQQHKAYVKQTFDVVASGYDSPVMRYFPFAADRLAAILKPERGSRVLDVATGTGMAAIALAQMIAPGGRVQGIDLSEKMLDKAYINIQKAGLTNIDLHTMDAEQLDFRSKYFDAASCAFGLFFLPDMLAGVKEIFRVMKPGCRFITSTFTQSAFSPQADMFREHLMEFGVDVPDGNWRALSTEQDCQQLLQDAGFEQTDCVIEQLGHHLAGSQDWWEIIWNSGFRALMEQLDAPQQAEFRLRHLAEIDKLADKDGIWLDVEVIFTLGTRPK